MRHNLLAWQLLLGAFIASALPSHSMEGSPDKLCPSMCNCEETYFSQLPIKSLLSKTQHNVPAEEQLPSYQHRNEVLDEADEHKTEHQLGQEKLKAAMCILQPTNNLPIFLSLPPDLQVLTILQGPSAPNLTLDESYFQHLETLVVLEIHGFHHGPGTLRVQSNALKNQHSLQYLNFQHLHLLGDKSLGNRRAPISGISHIKSSTNADTILFEGAMENNMIPEVVQFIPEQYEADVVPYNIYKDQQERAGLSIFAGLSNLLFLRAFHCNIKEVHWEMFDGLDRLEYLSLEGNKIPFLHEFSFYGTPNLKHLTISHNKLLSVQSTDLAGLLNLETLDLSYNNISHLSELSLPPLPQLIIADFHHNPLEVILPNTFQIMNNTEQLFLGGKQTKLEIRHGSFLGLNQIRKLSLNGVYLEVLEREYLKGMNRLKELKMEGVIHELAFDAFAEVSKLQQLILKHCSIHKISMDAFFGLYGLMYVDLSHNELETLPPSLFDQQDSLKEINLYNNKLTTLPEALFMYTPAKLIRLDKNPWHCTCSMHEWQPSQINKIKVKVTDDSLCQKRYDKSSMCKIHYIYRYMYEQSVSPRCATPARFSGWSVFHLLRKHLRCHEKLHKYKQLWHKQKGKINKIHMIEEFVKKRTLNQTLVSSSTSTVSLQSKITEHTLQPSNNATNLNTKTIVDISKEDERTTELSSNFTTEPTTNAKTTSLNIELGNFNQTSQNMWTKKDKDKYKLLQEKQVRILQKLNGTMAAENVMPATKKLNTDLLTKTKKKSDTQKKWEMKMENTMRRLNTVPGSNLYTP